VVCPMRLQNTGKLTLTSVTASSSPDYLSNNFATTSSLAPGVTVDCFLTAAAVQEDFDAGTLVLEVNATAAHLGDAAKSLAGTLSYGSSISLNKSASMDLTVSSEPSTVSASGGRAYVDACLNVANICLCHSNRRQTKCCACWLSLPACGRSEVCATQIP
jgi:hypothetical protein